MSIPEIIIKIKNRQGIRILLGYIIMITIGIGLFWAGVAIGAQKTTFQKPIIIYPPKVTIPATGGILTEKQNIETEGDWEAVASKSGKVYYPKNCTAYSRIKEENRVYFKSIIEVQDSGRILSALCK